MNNKKEVKATEQNSLAAKELQKFLNKVQGIMLIPKDKKYGGFEYAVLCLLLSPQTYRDFKDYGIKKTVVALLDNKYPGLVFRITENNKGLAGLSIVDEDSGLNFQLPDQGMSQPLLTFIKSEIPLDKIIMMCGVVENNRVLLDNEIFNNVLLILDGWQFE